MIRKKWFLVSAIVALSACATVPVAAPPHGFTPEQEGVLRSNGFKQNGDAWESDLPSRVLFASDQSKLVPAQEVALERTAHALAKIGLLGARVEGHTDVTGTDAHNEALSVRRAQSVADALAAGGMTPGLLVVSGLGKANPVQSNATLAGRRENRRVVIIISAPAQPL
jgi:outer membrane protein OmpA-like peptidoglycan-associated protein